MKSNDSYIIVAGILEDLIDEAKEQAAKSLGLDIATQNSEDKRKIYAKAISEALQKHILDELLYFFFKHTCMDKDGEEEIAEVELYIKAGEYFILSDKLVEADVDDLNEIDYEQIGLYFLFNKKIELEEDYFLTLSEQCQEHVGRITYLCELSKGKFASQGYAAGDYDTGYFSDKKAKCYTSKSDDFSFSDFLADKDDILCNVR